MGVITHPRSSHPFPGATSILTSHPFPALLHPSQHQSLHTLHPHLLFTAPPCLVASPSVRCTTGSSSSPFSVPADAETRQPTLGFRCGGKPRGGAFQPDHVSTQALRGSSEMKANFNLALKTWSDWHDRGKERFSFAAWMSRNKKLRGKDVRAFLANTWSRSSASKLEAMLKKVLFCPTGQRSYSCFEVRVVRRSKCFGKIN